MTSAGTIVSRVKVCEQEVGKTAKNKIKIMKITVGRKNEKELKLAFLSLSPCLILGRSPHHLCKSFTRETLKGGHTLYTIRFRVQKKVSCQA